MNTLYRPNPAAVYTGRDLAYRLRGKTAAQRATLAAEEGCDLSLLTPTVGQLARLYRVSVPTLAVARARVASGKRPSVKPRDRVTRGEFPKVEANAAHGRYLTGANTTHGSPAANTARVSQLNIGTDEDDIVRVIDALGAERVYRALDRLTAPMMRKAAE